MPTLAEIDGIGIEMFFNDHNPPHVHASYGEYEVLVEIRTGKIYSGKFPAAKLRIVRQYVEANRDELLVKWDALKQFRGGQ